MYPFAVNVNVEPEPTSPSSGGSNAQNSVAHLNGVLKNLQLAEASPEMQRLQLKTELNTTRFRLQQLSLDKQIMLEQFRAQERIIEEEIAMTMSKLGCNVGNADGDQETKPSVLCFQEDTKCPVSSEDGTCQILYPNLTENGQPSAPPLDQYLGINAFDALRGLHTITVRQLRKETLNEEYELLGLGDQLIYTANLMFSDFNKSYVPSYKMFQINFGTNEFPEAFTFRRGRKHMELIVGDQKAYSVLRQQALSRVVMQICDRADRPLLNIRAPHQDQPSCMFSIQTLQEVPIGSITKEVSPSSSPHLATNNCVIHFPEDLDVGCKAAVIAASFLIVNQEYEQMRKIKCQVAARERTGH